MIAVVGRPALGGARPGRDSRASDAPELGGLVAAVAIAVARAGGAVEVVGSVGDDAAGDRVAVELGRAGVGHAALLRDPAGTTPGASAAGGTEPAGPRPRLDAADIELGLRYLADCRVIVVAETLDEPAAAAVADAAAYHGAALVALVPGADAPAPFASATVLEVPAASDDPDDEDAGDASSFSAFVAAFAVALDGRSPAAEALATAAAATGWERAADA